MIWDGLTVHPIPTLCSPRWSWNLSLSSYWVGEGAEEGVEVTATCSIFINSNQGPAAIEVLQASLCPGKWKAGQSRPGRERTVSLRQRRREGHWKREEHDPGGRNM